MDKRLKFLMLMLIATFSLIFTSCSKSKIDAERKKQQEVLDRWKEVSSNLDDIIGIDDNTNSNTLKKKAENSLNNALFYYDEAISLTNYLNSINVDYAAMNSNEITVYTNIKNIIVYFDNIKSCQKYMVDGNYERVIECSNNALNYFNRSKEAYMNAGILNKYR